jgi:two-component system, LytTR family, response regulator LytT
MIRALIIEDERPAALRMEKLLQGIDPSIGIIDRLDTVAAAVKWFNSNPHPDLILLDIQLGDGLSFEIFSSVRVESYVIFTTAFDEFAIKAFELNSLDYLLKPVSEEKLARSIAKFRKFRDKGNSPDYDKLLETLDKREQKFKKRFIIQIAGKIRVIETDNVAWFYSKEKNTFLCSADNKAYPVDYSLDQIESIVNPELFFRVNRQFIVQYKSISRIDILSKSRIRIATNPTFEEEILISTARTAEFRNWLDR